MGRRSIELGAGKEEGGKKEVCQNDMETSLEDETRIALLEIERDGESWDREWETLRE